MSPYAISLSGLKSDRTARVRKQTVMATAQGLLKRTGCFLLCILTNAKPLPFVAVTGLPPGEESGDPVSSLGKAKPSSGERPGSRFMGPNGTQERVHAASVFSKIQSTCSTTLV